MRTFRLDRIASVRPSDGSFAVPADFDATTQVVSGIAAVPWAHEVSVVLHTSLAEAAERLPKSVGRLSEHADGVLFETRAERLEGMARMLAGLGWDFEVVTPCVLRDEVRLLSDRLRASGTAGATGHAIGAITDAVSTLSFDSVQVAGARADASSASDRQAPRDTPKNHNR